MPRRGGVLNHILGYVVLVAGVVGVAVGLYGMFLPNLRSRGISFHLPRLSRSGEEPEAADSLVAELERSGFAKSPFEAPAPAAPPPTRPVAPPQRVEAPAPRIEDVTAIDEVEDSKELIAVEDDDPLIDDAPPPDEPDDSAESTAPESEQPKVIKVMSVAESPTGDLLSLFDEATVYSAAPSVIRDAIEDVTIEDLLSEARELQRLLGGSNRPAA